MLVGPTKFFFSWKTHIHESHIYKTGQGHGTAYSGDPSMVVGAKGPEHARGMQPGSTIGWLVGEVEVCELDGNILPDSHEVSTAL
jgi:hypothetical protein